MVEFHVFLTFPITSLTISLPQARFNTSGGQSDKAKEFVDDFLED